MPSNTCSTKILVMHRKSIGHSRKKQGEHGALPLSNRCLASPRRPGAVRAGEVLPKGTMTEVPSAAATCIGPESLVNSTRESFNVDIKPRRVEPPAQLMIRVLASASTSL